MYSKLEYTVLHSINPLLSNDLEALQEKKSFSSIFDVDVDLSPYYFYFSSSDHVRDTFIRVYLGLPVGLLSGNCFIDGLSN
jgi:hypothetical protein